MKTTNKDLIQQLLNGNEKAYGTLYEEHYANLCHLANYYVRDKFTAETVVEDVIFHLWNNRENLNINISLHNYLLRAVRNKCLDYLKLKRNQTEQSLSALSKESSYYVGSRESTESPFGDILSQELEEEIAEAINCLPKECRTVFLMSRMENKKNKEIADELGVSINTVKYHLKNALKFLNEKLEKYLVFIVPILLMR